MKHNPAFLITKDSLRDDYPDFYPRTTDRLALEIYYRTNGGRARNYMYVRYIFDGENIEGAKLLRAKLDEINKTLTPGPVKYVKPEAHKVIQQGNFLSRLGL